MGTPSRSASRSRPTTPKSSAPSSRAHSVSTLSAESSSTRRRRNKKKGSKALTPNLEGGVAGPSKPSRSPTPRPSMPAAAEAFGNQDFIPFDLDILENTGNAKKEPQEKEQNHPPRPWDRGKPRVQRNLESDHAGRKRKVDEVDSSDAYSGKRYKADPAYQKAPWIQDVDVESCTNAAQLLHLEVDAFVKYISPTPEEDEIRSLTVTQITNAITAEFPDAKVYPFGSYETKLYLPEGDIDLVIDCERMAYYRPEKILYALAQLVRQACLTDNVRVIAKAKVPIIKFVTTHGRLSVDISINQKNGIAAGKMIKNFLIELPALRSLVLVIKSFLNQRGMNEVFTGGLGSYSIVCLAISFLQMHPKIRRGEIDPEKNLGVLVIEFFELYGWYFNYNEVGISLRNGGSYFNKFRRGWVASKAPHLLSIEDPGDSSNDISKGTFGIARVRAALAGAHGILTTNAYERAKYISERRDRFTRHRQKRRSPESMSILATVMGVTEETIVQRRRIRDLYESRMLHQWLGVEPRIKVTVDDKQNGRKRPSKQTSQAYEESVKSAWNDGEADMELGTSDVETNERTMVEEVDESRYGIADLPPKKRRRTGKSSEAHTVYVVDHDDDEYVPSDGGTSEEEEYDVRGSKKQARRSYWLRKAHNSLADDDQALECCSD